MGWHMSNKSNPRRKQRGICHAALVAASPATGGDPATRFACAG